MHLMKSEVPLIPLVKFYPNEDEKRWANKFRSELKGHIVALVPNGSSVSKMWPHAMAFAKQLLAQKDVTVVMLGDKRGMDTTELDDHRRFVNIGMDWSIRQAMTFCQLADVVVGQETGLLNCVSHEEAVHKVVLFTHSSVKNLTRDWPNTTNFRKMPKCAGESGCHRLHYDWSTCNKNETTQAAECQSMISAEEVVAIVNGVLDKKKEIVLTATQPAKVELVA
jgi:ADP-heptose:LPS heptosyltransferase